ncbi:MAG: hypothetical protein [Wendovervirus sonii]|uniref:Uncharacterized protein n=1 Tax=phage Lak_Megaphage_Sonny TaxID=3109229 RepID=A0ABZ0Z4K9_9CAUD|nr:MAG: hypothetical protein [phage Lak_Megaphage_Sonny]
MKNLRQILNESNDLFEDELFEETNELEVSSEKQMSEEDLKVESLKIATNIAKLMSDVTPEDIIQIATKVSDFIKNHKIGSFEKGNDIESMPNDLK